jgi:hypothetical protein
MAGSFLKRANALNFVNKMLLTGAILPLKSWFKRKKHLFGDKYLRNINKIA